MIYEEQRQAIQDRAREQRRGRIGESRGRLTSRAEDAGLRGPQIDQFVGLGEEARGLRSRERRSQAARDIMQQQRELAGAQRGVAAAGRGPFAGAGQQAAQRAIGASGAQAAALAGAADQARIRQADEMMQDLQAQGAIQQYQREQAMKAAREERKGMLGSFLGSATGAVLGGIAGGPAGAEAGGQFGGQFGQMVSDEDMKSNVKDGNSRARSMLDALSAKEYDIDGERDYGVMAQDMPEDMVSEVNGVKTIPEGFGKLLAGMANLNDRLRKLEGK
tara:strand:+ start:11069 stop:11896 length:828 start_codon:yes stop_codon:yes gene_type:complete